MTGGQRGRARIPVRDSAVRGRCGGGIHPGGASAPAPESPLIPSAIGPTFRRITAGVRTTLGAVSAVFGPVETTSDEIVAWAVARSARSCPIVSAWRSTTSGPRTVPIVVWINDSHRVSRRRRGQCGTCRGGGIGSLLRARKCSRGLGGGTASSITGGVLGRGGVSISAPGWGQASASEDGVSHPLHQPQRRDPDGDSIVRPSRRDRTTPAPPLGGR